VRASRLLLDGAHDIKSRLHVYRHSRVATLFSATSHALATGTMITAPSYCGFLPPEAIDRLRVMRKPHRPHKE